MTIVNILIYFSPGFFSSCMLTMAPLASTPLQPQERSLPSGESLYLRPGKASWIRPLWSGHLSSVIFLQGQHVQVSPTHRCSQSLISLRPEQQAVPQPCWAVFSGSEPTGHRGPLSQNASVAKLSWSSLRADRINIHTQTL